MADQVDAKIVKDIKIKSGVVKRLAKEKTSYEKETEKIQEKLEKMKTDNPEDYMIRKQQELLEESAGMIPDCHRRLVTAWEDLRTLMDERPELSGTPEYQTAQGVLDETRSAVAH